jgi:hypothetical protein
MEIFSNGNFLQDYLKNLLIAEPSFVLRSFNAFN